MTEAMPIQIGQATITPELTDDGLLRSLGVVKVNGTDLRGSTRFLPWFDSFDGEIFDRLYWGQATREQDGVCFHLEARSNSDYPFCERRDSSGDPVLRETSWDAQPATAAIRVQLRPAELELGGRLFAGLRYWFEVDSPQMKVHRLLDRQSWEIAGSLTGSTLICRNWMTPPRTRLSRRDRFTTAALPQQSGLMPGSMWGRWSLLPPFEFVYGCSGILISFFDQVANIRSVLQSGENEDALRIMDLHHREATHQFRSVPKTILFNPDPVDDTQAINLWTLIQDREAQRAREQLNIADDGPPALVLSDNQWVDYLFESSYHEALAVAAEFGLDYLYIDVAWEQMQALKQELQRSASAEGLAAKLYTSSMCSILDFKIAEEHGGVSGLAQLCDQARGRGVGILSWIGCHLSPQTSLGQRRPELNDPADGGLFAMKESGRHPDSGYAAECWPLNLNGPVRDYLRDQVLEASAATGLSGLLWDSFSNIGWWQLNYANGTMRPQFDRFAQIMRYWIDAGLYLMPEGLCAFSNHNCLGALGESDFSGEMAAFAYNSHLGLHPEDQLPLDQSILAGETSIDSLFKAFSHKHVPVLTLHQLPREQWDPAAADGLKRLFSVYRQCRERMIRRLVLDDEAGVRWTGHDEGDVLWTYRPIQASVPCTRICDDEVSDLLDPYQVYSVPVHASLICRQVSADVVIKGK